MFLQLTKFIFWLPLLHEVSGNMCFAIGCQPGCDVMNFEVDFIFLIKPFFLHDQKVMTKFKYLENKKNFHDEIKSIFHHFWTAFNG